jgi:hypothetical protein
MIDVGLLSREVGMGHKRGTTTMRAPARTTQANTSLPLATPRRPVFAPAVP